MAWLIVAVNIPEAGMLHAARGGDAGDGAGRGREGESLGLSEGLHLPGEYVGLLLLFFTNLRKICAVTNACSRVFFFQKVRHPSIEGTYRAP